MFDWFRRRREAPKPERRSPAKPRATRPGSVRPTKPSGPAPLPEVVAEGSTEADWSAWEDSMTAWNSQLQGLGPNSEFQVRDTRPTKLDELDPFAGVRRKRDV
jgi:hypothetical protein